MESHYIPKTMFNIKSQSSDQRLRSFFSPSRRICGTSWVGFYPLHYRHTQAFAISLLTLHPGHCGSLQTGPWHARWSVGACGHLAPMAPRLLELGQPANGQITPPSTTETDTSCLCFCVYKGGMDRSTLLLQVMPPDIDVSDVDPWYWFSLLLVLVFSLGLVNHIPTHLANKETFKYCDHFPLSASKSPFLRYNSNSVRLEND